MGISDFLLKMQIKNFVKGMCFAFKTSYFAAKNKYPTKLNRELLCLSLETRPNWEKVGICKYIFIPTGESINISKNFSLAELVKSVGIIEVKKSLENLYEEERQPLLSIFDREIKNFL